MQAQPEDISTMTGCPMKSAAERFHPFEHEGMYDLLAELRATAPVFYSPQIDYWVVTRREDVIATLRDHERFSAVVATQPVVPWPPELIQYLVDRGFTNESVQVACDPPRHSRIRSHVQGFLNPKKLQSFEASVRELVCSYVERMKGKETVDLVDAMTYELPAMTAFLLLGVKDIDPRRIKSWTELRVKLMHGFPTREEQMAAADDLLDFWRFSCDLVEQRKISPGDDYPSWLLASRAGDDERLTENEIKSLTFALLLAAHETTSNASANIILELLRRPDDWAALIADPTLIPNAVEEGFRYVSSVVAWRRMAKEDFELGGQSFPAGTKLLLSLASAGRDEASYENGDTFDIRRKNARSHVAFGNGIHFCMGAPIARMQIRMMIEELTKTFPRMTLVENAEIEIAGVLTFRGPASLPVRLNG
ncbi:cytochrome P450 [Novosphingobium cyanobacteriorum]|uniref:Cytochrome P450 n=1 Tax=Novosphingobium cyanobacteriorum TaxID=3024215 RepID=A0ABT6CQF1_9SPHN|nr:cytochrome P450 [Novosphingobium cyanobacteriorum]MDF8335370.1 cytochrome P450 [Novosphingobium cyanobacteriorum]